MITPFEVMFNHFDPMMNTILIFRVYPTNPKELPKGSFSVARFMMCRCVMQIQMCICGFLIQGGVERSVLINFHCYVKEIDRFSARLMFEFNFIMDVVWSMGPYHEYVIYEPKPN